MFGLIGVIDNSAHEHEISAARGRGGNGKCQNNGERKDEEENSEDKGDFFKHGCGGKVVQVVWDWVCRYSLDTTKAKERERE